jgi:hypothetical protein
MNRIAHKIKTYLAFFGLCSIVMLVNGCDTLENDVTPNGASTVVSDKEFHVISNGRGYIDLYSIIKTHGEVRMNISSQPSNGDLKEVAAGLLRYSPHKAFEKGRDAFALSFFDKNDKLLLTDSIVIIVDDSTNVPCGVYPKDDWVYSGGPIVDVEVLSNDFICGDSSEYIVEVYKPGNHFPPYLGTASVVNNQIRYIASNQNITTIDTVVYKVTKVGNNDIVGFATLHINAQPQDNTCHPIKNYLWSTIRPDPIIDTLVFVVLDDKNLNFCGVPYDNVSVVSQPKHGTASPFMNYYIKYAYELTMSNQVLQDTLQYRVCDGSNCLVGDIYVRIN